MRKILGGHRPDITPAQIVAGIPVLATLLNVFGVYHLSQEQQDALSAAVLWALGLVGFDAVLRVGRAHADAKVQAAALAPVSPEAAPPGTPPPGVVVEAPLTEDEIRAELGAEEIIGGVPDLPTDAEEAAAPPPLR